MSDYKFCNLTCHICNVTVVLGTVAAWGVNQLNNYCAVTFVGNVRILLCTVGYVLFQQKTPETALCLLSELIKQVDLSRELSLNVRNLIGCCLSSQVVAHFCCVDFKAIISDRYNLI